MRPSRILMVGVLLMLVASWAGAGDTICAHCSRAAPCKKICRLVCEEKKVPIVCWGCADEEFCLPRPSKPIGKHKEFVRADCDPQGNAKVKTGPAKFVWFDWLPNPKATVHTKRKLMKKTITKTVPGYKWVVETVCAACETQCVSVVPEPGVPVPPPPTGALVVKPPRR